MNALPPITQVLLLEQSALARFRRALRRDDQLVLDDLLDFVQVHDLPFEMLLLFVLLAEGKEVLRLWQQIDLYSDTAQESVAQASALWIPSPRTAQDG